MFLFDTTPLLYHTFWSLSRTFLKYFYFSQPLLPQWIFILTRFFISVNMFSYLFLCSFGWTKKKNLDVAKISFLHFINKNGERGIWTLAPVTRPTPLAGAPLRPLEYFSVKKNIHTAWLPPSDKQSPCMQIPISNFIGGESGIRTRGRRNRHRFSRPALSTTQTSLQMFVHQLNWQKLL